MIRTCLRVTFRALRIGGFRPLRRRQLPRKLVCEPLEDRCVPAGFMGLGGVAHIVGDGSFPTIQGALDAAAELPGANTIEVVPGTHREDLTIADSDALTLVGLGEPGDVRIVGHGESNPIIDITLQSDLTLMNLSVQGSDGDGIKVRGGKGEQNPHLTLTDVQSNRNAGTGLKVHGAGDVEISGGRFNNNADGGIQLVDVAGNVILNNNVTNNNDADHDGVGDGIHARDGNDADDLAIGGVLSVSDSRMQDTDGAGSNRQQIYGLHVLDGIGFRSTSAFLLNNTATGNDQDGIRIVGSSGNILVSGGSYSGNGNDGLRLLDTGSPDLFHFIFATNLRANHNGDEGIDVDGLSGSVILFDLQANNNSDDGAQVDSVGDVLVGQIVTNNNGHEGVDIKHSGNVTVTNARANNNGRAGIQLGWVGDVEVGNISVTGIAPGGVRANNNGRHGLEIRHASNITVREARLSRNGSDGFFLDGALTVTVLNSRFNNNGDDGLQVFHAEHIEVVDSIFNNNEDDGVQVLGSGNVDLTRVRANRNGDDGIQIRRSGDVTANETTARNNGDDGLQVINSGTVTIHDGVYSGNGDDDISIL